MYALIYDEFDPAKREKRVISVHKTRVTAEKALTKRQHKLGKRVWDCKMEIRLRPTLLIPGLRVKKFQREIGFRMWIKGGFPCYAKLFRLRAPPLA